MSEKVSENVILIDVAFLNLVINDIKMNFERMLGRPLGTIDVSDLLVYLALDAGIRGTENSTHVIFVYDEEHVELKHTEPANLQEELHGVAFDDTLGEFIISSFKAELLVGKTQLYQEFFKTLASDKDVKTIILVASDKDDAGILDIARGVDDKELVLFRMLEPASDASLRWEVLAYPIMQALGIKGSELN